MCVCINSLLRIGCIAYIGRLVTFSCCYIERHGAMQYHNRGRNQIKSRFRIPEMRFSLSQNQLDIYTITSYSSGVTITIVILLTSEHDD